MKKIRILRVLVAAFCIFLFACGDDEEVERYYTVSFATAGIECEECRTQTVRNGTTIILPIPTMEDFLFNGWYNYDYTIRFGGGGDDFRVNQDVEMFPEFQN